MKYKFFTISILIIFFGYGQKKSTLLETDSDNKIKWAEYYSVNKNYQKTINYFSKIEDSLSPSNRRLYSNALKNMNRLKEASIIMDPLLQSDFATVSDYYEYIFLIPENKKLVEEYIQKAKKLPLEANPISISNKSNSTYKIVNLKFNTEKSEFGPALVEPSWGLLFFLGDQRSIGEKINSNNQVYNLFKTNINLNSLETKPVEEFDSKFNSIYQDGPISLNSTSKMLYLTRTTNKIKNNKNIELNIFQVPFKNIGKEAPYPLELNIDGYTSFHPSVSPDGKTLYFSSDRPGGYGGMDIYYVNIENDKPVGEVKNLGPDINTENDEVFPFCFSKKILFYSSNQNTEKKFNIYIASNKVYNRWGKSILSKPFNSSEDDTSFSLEKKIRTGFLSSNRNGGKGDDDIYAFKFKPKITGEKDFYGFHGTDTLIVGLKNVLNNDVEKMISNDPLIQIIPFRIILIDDVKSGELKLNSNGSFWYRSNSFKTEKDSFSYKIITDYGNSEKINVLLENNYDYNKVFRPIYFNFNKSDIKRQFKPRLDSIVKALNVNPNLKIEISSFADCRGSQEYNLKLTEERNKTIMDYIQSSVDNPKRIDGNAYGESQVEGNSSFRYTILIAVFNEETEANDFVNKSKLEEGDFEITRFKKHFQVNLGNFSSYEIAAKSLENIIKLYSNANIRKIKCGNRSELFHGLNRKTTFKLFEIN